MATTPEALPNADAMSVPPNPRPLWRNRDYMLLWSGQTISAIGSGVSGLAFPLLILALTHDAAKAGISGALGALPYLVFSLPAGALIDRWNRKRVMILCDIGRGLALGSIPVALYLGQLTIVQIYLAALVEGSCFVFFNIAEVACLPRVVPKAQLPAANGQNQATGSLSILISQPLGGAIYSLNQMLPFVGDAISYIVSVVSLAFIKTRFQGERTATGEPRHLGREIREGLAWLWHQRLIRFTAFLTGGLNFVLSGSFLITILLAQHLGATPFIIGIIGAISAVGGILGSLVAPWFQKRLSFGQAVMMIMIVQSIIWPLQIFAPNPYVLGAIAAALFIVVPIFNVVILSYRIVLIPDRLQGRVNSSIRLLAFGFQPLGLALTGVLLQQFGTTVAVLALWTIFLGGTLLGILNPDIRHAPPIAQAGPSADGG